MRLAMQAGARDILSEPVSEADLFAALERVSSELRGVAAPPRTRSFAFVNAKGGSGATFLAATWPTCSLRYGDRKPDRRSRHAVRDVAAISRRAAETWPARGVERSAGTRRGRVDAYLTRHASGLRVWRAPRFERYTTSRCDYRSVCAATGHVEGECQRIVFDVPRHLDPLGRDGAGTGGPCSHRYAADLPSLRDATRLNDIVRERTRCSAGPRLGACESIPKRYLCRTQRHHGACCAMKIPSSCPITLAPVAESIDSGVPIYEHARSSPVTKAIIDSRCSSTANNRRIHELHHPHASAAF